MPARHRIVVPLAIMLVGVIALIGYLLGQSDSPLLPQPPADSRLPSAADEATRLAITPRLPGNATIRTTPSPFPTAKVELGRSPLPLPTRPPPAPESHEPLPPLIFARAGQIWRSDGTGAAPRQLTNFDTASVPSQPSISPDGTKIAFVALIQPPITSTLPLPTSKLFLMDLQGTNLREIWAPKEGILWLPTWTPDQQALYLLANGTVVASAGGDSTNRLQIVRVGLEQGDRTVILSSALDPTIARDGKRMAYLKFDPDGVTMHVETADLDGQHAQRIISGKEFLGFYAPRFTPDGKQIIVAAIEGPPTDKNGFPLADSPRPHLSEWMLGLFAPPTAEAHGAPWDLWIVNSDGSGLRRLTKLNEDLPMAAFSPDGSTVAVLAYNGMYLMNPDGSNLRRIDPRGDHGGLDWIR
jgi:Tol biopolymer transport system component